MGRQIALASRKIQVWDWTADKLICDWPGHGNGITDLAIGPDGDLLASGGRDGMVRVRSIRTGREVFALNAHQLAVTSVTFSPDSERLATAGQEGDMHIWNVKQRRRLFTLHGHSGAVWEIWPSTPDGSGLFRRLRFQNAIVGCDSQPGIHHASLASQRRSSGASL